MIRMAIVVLVLSGCSYAFQQHAVPACSTSKRLAKIDLGIAIGEALIGMTGVAIHANVGHLVDHEDRGNVLAGAGLFTAIVQGASADTGRIWANECRATNASLATGTPR